jgi:hypothetical protein
MRQAYSKRLDLESNTGHWVLESVVQKSVIAESVIIHFVCIYGWVESVANRFSFCPAFFND